MYEYESTRAANREMLISLIYVACKNISTQPTMLLLFLAIALFARVCPSLSNKMQRNVNGKW